LGLQTIEVDDVIRASALLDFRRATSETTDYWSRRIKMKSYRTISAAAILISFTAIPCWGAIIDLTAAGNTGTINGAIYQQGEANAGTGVFPAFLGIQASPTESGYNTNSPAGVLDDKTGTFTNAITLGQLSATVSGGISYYTFALDVHENNSGADRYISLDEVRVYVGGSATVNLNAAPPPDSSNSSFGSMVYRMDAGADSTVALLSTLSAGSGHSDMYLLIPTTDFAGHASTEQVILYSHFGDLGVLTGTPPNPVGTNTSLALPDGNYDTTATHEEWSYQTLPGPGQVTLPTPEPASMAVWALGLALCGGWGLRRRFRAA